MKNIQIDDFAKFKLLSDVQFSPNGKYACFVVHQGNVEDNSYKSNLWVYKVEDNSCFQLTTFDKEGSFIWLDDSEHVLFAGLRDEKDKKKQKEGEELTVFYRIGIYGGEAQEAFRLPFSVTSIKEVNNNQFLFTANINSNFPVLGSLQGEEKEKELKRRKKERDYQVIDEIPYWFNGEGFTNGNRNRLFSYNIATGQWEPITKEKMQVEKVRFNNDKSKAIVIGSFFESKMEMTNTIYILNTQSLSLKRISPEKEFTYADAHFIQNNKLLCLGSDMKRYGINENSRFYLMEADSGKKQLLTPDFDCSTWNSVGSDCRRGGGEQVKLDGEHLYFITTEDDSSYINRIDVTGKIQKITREKGSVDSYDVKGGKIIFSGLRKLKLQELYLLQKDKEKQITSFNDWVQKERKISSLEPLTVKTPAGKAVDGWVMKPTNIEKDKKYPAILNIHGGPKTVYGEVFYHEMQYWAGQGYYVFFCNPRGSDGKGNSFADIRGKYGTIDFDDLMAFTDVVFKKYDGIDKERVGVTGGSYGGFMTNWIIGHTDRFKAAVSQRSISNWISMGYTTDIGYFFEEDQMAATPWDNIEKVWFHSPLKYANKVNTPTLFIHSDEDYRCWTPEALQMFTALKYHGVESRLCLFKGENHELSRGGRPQQRVKRLTEITQWFDKYLK
ncbi:S9 family peptidase [Proteinivorax tanatarense]|uniref:S9 family peptidase n=1 Tax=Proteinivorax tanatarense TaxID=1260629 RepID=A0AAU7VKU4_9FIRM